MLRFLLIAVVLCGCSSAAVEYVKVKNPTCKVEILDRARNQAEISIRCPGEAPRIEVVRER